MTKIHNDSSVRHVTAHHDGKATKRYETVFLNDKTSLALAQKIKRPATKKEIQLEFGDNGFTSPSGHPLQLVYLSKAGSAVAKDYGIAYVDHKDGNFWAQQPGISGLVRGPFELPEGFKPEAAPSPKPTGHGLMPDRICGSEASPLAEYRDLRRTEATLARIRGRE